MHTNFINGNRGVVLSYRFVREENDNASGSIVFYHYLDNGGDMSDPTGIVVLGDARVETRQHEYAQVWPDNVFGLGIFPG